jgi:hypothetical protein
MTRGKTLSILFAVLGAACSSSSSTTGGSTGTSGGTTGTKSTTTGTSGATSSSGSSHTSSTSGATNGASSSSGGTANGYPCVLGAGTYQPTVGSPPVAGCYCNGSTYAQILNGCPPVGSTPDTTIPLPPPAGNESLPLYVDGGFPQSPPSQ